MLKLSFLVLSILIISSSAAPQPKNTRAAAPCDNTVCLPPDCRCSTAGRPSNIELSETPQFVFLTFDDAVTADHFDKFYVKALFNRTNPDGCDMGVTHFMSHQYTDYSLVHELYRARHEIALHSVTHSPYTEYWKNLTLDQEIAEFGDEAEIIARFANIPREAIKGMRVPLLQLNGDLTFEAGKEIGLEYDCSWPTQTYRTQGLWPYTLDYETTQDCAVGPCPEDSIPGFWVVPMIDWLDLDNVVCSMVDGCAHPPDTEDETLQWYKDNFNLQYEGTKAPWGFYVHAAFFDAAEMHFDAYIRFIDYLNTLPDVYIVNISRGLEWLKNPVAMGSADWPGCPEIDDLGCEKQTAPLLKEDDQTTMYMTFCGDRPEVYPWLGNPNGIESNGRG